MNDVSAQDAVLARQHVDGNFGDSGAVRIIEEGPALPPVPVPMDFWRCVKTGRGQRHTAKIGRLYRVGKAEAGGVAKMHTASGKAHRITRQIMLCRQKITNAQPDGAGRRLRRHAIKIRAGRGRRGRGVGHLAGACCGDFDRIYIDLEFIGDNLRHLGVEALAHFGAAMIELHRAVIIDMDKGARLIEKLCVEGNAEFHRRQGNAALDQIIGAVERLNLSAPPGVVGRYLQLVNDVLNDAIGDRLAIVGDALLGGGNRSVRIEITPPDNQWIEAQMMRHLVNRPLHPQHPLRPAKAAKGRV